MSEINIKSSIENGRPSETRLPKEEAVYDLLENLNIDFQRLDHDATASMEDCQKIGQILNVRICKNLFLCNRQKTQFYLLMIPGDKEFRTKDLSKQINSARLSFAGADYMDEFLNITPGSVSVMGLMNDTDNRVQLLIDSDVLKNDHIGCHPCINTSSIKLKTRDLTDQILPYINHQPISVEL